MRDKAKWVGGNGGKVYEVRGGERRERTAEWGGAELGRAETSIVEGSWIDIREFRTNVFSRRSQK